MEQKRNASNNHSKKSDKEQHDCENLPALIISFPRASFGVEAGNGRRKIGKKIGSAPIFHNHQHGPAAVLPISGHFIPILLLFFSNERVKAPREEAS
jgi:hypothetical protein